MTTSTGASLESGSTPIKSGGRVKGARKATAILATLIKPPGPSDPPVDSLPDLPDDSGESLVELLPTEVESLIKENGYYGYK